VLSAAGVEAKASVTAVGMIIISIYFLVGMAASIAVAAAAAGRLPVAVVIKVDITEAMIAVNKLPGLAAEVAVAGVGMLAAAAIVVLLDGKATYAFPAKSIQKRFGSLRTARSARPSTLAQYAVGRVFWIARRRGRSRFVSR
jgi:hypothetical protein